MSDVYFEITLPCEEAARESLANFFFEKGAAGVEEKESGLVAYFSHPVNFHEALSTLVDSLQDLNLAVGQPRVLKKESQDWSQGWRAYFKPVQVTDTVVIKPPWEPAPDSGVVIDIMPRMAFGTGTHETTRLCVMLMEPRVKPGMSVLDLGAGSAVLSIAAAKLGAVRVLAVEIDEVAVENAVENCQANGVDHRVEIRTGSMERVGDETFDLILANINRDVLLGLIPQLKPHLNPKGRLILSGLLETDGDIITTALTAAGFTVDTVRQEGEWLGFLIRIS